MKVLIFSLGEKGFSVVSALNNLIGAHSIHCIVGQDSNVVDDYSASIVNFCREKGIGYSFRKEAAYSVTDHDLFLAVGWRWMIDDIPQEKLIVFHDSLLPKYRGFSPLVNALINKESMVGVTVLLGAKDYDKGNILLQKSIDVSYPTTIGQEIKRISTVYATLAVELIEGICDKSLSIEGYPQSEELASYSLWRDSDDYRIDWKNNAIAIEHFVNCVSWPFEGASSLLDCQIVRIFKAIAVADVKIENRTPGKVIFVEEDFPVVVCGEGLLIIKDLRSDSGKSMLPLSKFRSKFQ